MKNFSLFFLFLIAISLVFSAHAKKTNPATIDDQELQNIKTSVNNHGNSIANIQNQVNDVTKKVQTLTGDIGRNYKENRDQEKLITDTQTRLQTIEDKITALTSQLLELQTEGFLSPQATKRIKEYKNYAKGLAYVNAGEYDKAIKSMKTFQSQYPKSIFQSYAQYWISESYYMQSDFPMAIKQYQELLRTNPRSAKAPTALYRQGLSFFQLKAFDDAKAFFAKVVRTYPKSVEAIQASGQIKRINTIQELNRQKDLETKLVQ